MLDLAASNLTFFPTTIDQQKNKNKNKTSNFSSSLIPAG